MTARMRGAGQFQFNLREFNAAFADIGTLLPYMLSTIVLVGISPTAAIACFALAYIATAGYYRLPVPVQPMKAIAAVAITSSMTPESLFVSGFMIGLLLVVLGLTGWIDKLCRLVPQSIIAGLKVGLGFTLSLTALSLMADDPWIAAGLLAVFVLLMYRIHEMSILFFLAVALAAGQILDLPGLRLPEQEFSFLAGFHWPDLAILTDSLQNHVLPQLSLTLTNAVMLTALIAHEIFGPQADHVTARRLSLSSGFGNLFLTPLGAIPMCHGAGGLIAHHRFGARTGGAPLIIGLVLLVLVLLPDRLGLAWLSAIPVSALGVLLLIASLQLAASRRLIDARPSCYPVIAITAIITVVIGPFWGLMAGTGAEILRKAIIRRLAGHQQH